MLRLEYKKLEQLALEYEKKQQKIEMFINGEIKELVLCPPVTQNITTKTIESACVYNIDLLCIISLIVVIVTWALYRYLTFGILNKSRDASSNLVFVNVPLGSTRNRLAMLFNREDNKNLFFELKSMMGFVKKFKTWKLINFTRIAKIFVLDFLLKHLVFYPTPVGLSYAWSFGALAGISLVIQIVSGIFLSTHYTANILLAFKSIEYIMRDVPNGWFIRYVHANGASMFFIVVYLHICRGVYYGSYMEPRQHLWNSGVVLFFLIMGTAFTGYILPWGQMSYWGATVITSMVTALPWGGTLISQWLWGGYRIGNPTLNRIYSLHFLLPFLIVGVTLIHLALLHKEGSSNPVTSDTGLDETSFYPYFGNKDLYALGLFVVVFSVFLYFFPNVLNHHSNYTPADAYKTPPHVVPEWYFLPFFTVLRSIPHKAAGIAAMLASILILLILPHVHNSNVRNTSYRPMFKYFFAIFFASFVLLLWDGDKPIDSVDTYLNMGAVFTAVYFFFFFLLLIAGKAESNMLLSGEFFDPNTMRILKVLFFSGIYTSIIILYLARPELFLHWCDPNASWLAQLDGPFEPGDAGKGIPAQLESAGDVEPFEEGKEQCVSYVSVVIFTIWLLGVTKVFVDIVVSNWPY